jgi:hypothetical protein
MGGIGAIGRGRDNVSLPCGLFGEVTLANRKAVVLGGADELSERRESMLDQHEIHQRLICREERAPGWQSRSRFAAHRRRRVADAAVSLVQG